MDTFPILKRKDEAAHGTYRTKDTILAIYDAMQTAIRTGIPFQTHLNPPPGPPTMDLPTWTPGEPKPLIGHRTFMRPKGARRPGARHE